MTGVQTCALPIYFSGITGYPELVHGDIETQNLSELGEFVSKMVGIGAITPDESMEDYLRMAADLPERDFDTTYLSRQSQNPPFPPPAAAEGSEGEI